MSSSQAQGGISAPDAAIGIQSDTLVGEATVPPAALFTSILALIVSGAASFVWPESLATLSGFVWLLALIPSFLMAYHKGWEGAAIGLAGAMVLLVVIEVVDVKLMGGDVDWRVTGAVTFVLITVSLGAGWFAEALLRQRAAAIDMAHVDPLTGLPNRRTLHFSLSHHFGRVQRGFGELSVVLFDLDHFKTYNDRHGHQAGDDALRLVGSVLREQTRRSDVSGRYGGEEFLTLLPGEGAKAAQVFAERIRQSVAGQEISTGDRLTISAGVASFDSSMKEVEELLETADRALYGAKSQGRDQVVVATRERTGGFLRFLVFGRRESAPAPGSTHEAAGALPAQAGQHHITARSTQDTEKAAP
jgi:diguanylate cyclase (GGDEF)-like protein